MLFLLNGLHLFDCNIWVFPKAAGGERHYCNFNKPNLEKTHLYAAWVFKLSLVLLQDCEHSVVQLSRPVRIKKTPFRSRQSMRSAVINKSALTNQSPDTSEEPSTETTDVTHNTDEQQSGPVNGSMSESEEGKCKHLYLRFVNTQTPDFICVKFPKQAQNSTQSADARFYTVSRRKERMS